MTKLARIPDRLTEKQFQGFVVSVAKLYGWWVYHTFNSKRSEPGFPDLVLVREPDLIFAELKTDKGKLTKEQAAVIAKLQRCGQRVAVWRPRDWDSLTRILSHKRNTTNDDVGPRCG